MELDDSEYLSMAAEAILYKGSYLGTSSVLKQRKQKKYRTPHLDRTLNKKRTQTEANVLATALLNDINVPPIRYVDYDKYSIVMDMIEGKPLKEYTTTSYVHDLFYNLGIQIAKLHAIDIIHGDLTTSNVIVTKDLQTYLIDFGLAKFSGSVEDKAVDLLVLHRTLISTHSQIVNKAWSALLTGYESISEIKSLLKRMETIEGRKRYSGH